MESAWAFVPQLFPVGELADLLGERHRIIANDWQAAALAKLTARILDRAADVLDRVDFTPAGLRADLASGRVPVDRLYSAGELIDHAADLVCESSALVHQNERRWRVFRARVEQVIAERAAS
jgi:hypothetical protein